VQTVCRREVTTYSFAKTPLKAAHAPLATARISHWDRRLIFCISIFEASSSVAQGSVPEEVTS